MWQSSILRRDRETVFIEVSITCCQSSSFCCHYTTDKSIDRDSSHPNASANNQILQSQNEKLHETGKEKDWNELYSSQMISMNIVDRRNRIATIKQSKNQCGSHIIRQYEDVPFHAHTHTHTQCVTCDFMHTKNHQSLVWWTSINRWAARRRAIYKTHYTRIMYDLDRRMWYDSLVSIIIWQIFDW